LWVSGSFKGKGYGKDLINYCIDDAKSQNKSGVCVISSKKKTPFISAKKFMQKCGFEVVDGIGDMNCWCFHLTGRNHGLPKMPENKALKTKSLLSTTAHNALIFATA
jgi:hypothetical protein